MAGVSRAACFDSKMLYLSDSLRSGTTQEGIAYIACGPQGSQLGVVFIHGWACRASNFTYLFTELFKTNLNFHAIAVDLPGHGQSSTKSYPKPRMRAFADAVLAVVNELDISNIVLVGHSMGLRVILEAWSQAQSVGRPQVEGLVFLDGSHYKFRTSLFAFDSGNARSKALTQEEKAEKMAEAFKRMFSTRTPADFQESTLAHVRNLNPYFNVDMRQSHVSYDYERMDDVLEDIGKAGTPVLSLQATNVDEQNQRVSLRPRERSRWMEFVQEMIPQARQSVIEESMHFVMVDQPAEVAKKLIEFVNGLEGVK